MANSLDDDLHFAQRRYELDEVACCIEILAKWVTQYSPPEFASDRQAKLSRLEHLGAIVVSRSDGWVVMQAPEWASVLRW